MRTRIKICGVKRAEDAIYAATCGADAVGAVFIQGSPREVLVSDVRAVFSSLPPFVSRVGLFRNAEAEYIREIIDLSGLSLLQFHGNECDSDCRQYGLPYIRAINGDEPHAVATMHRKYPSATGYVLDSVARGEGGTGRTFDWDNWPTQSSKPLILAGGLNPDNVQLAISTLAPWGVDVSTGVEDGIKGVKSHGKIRSFIENARSAACGQ